MRKCLQFREEEPLKELFAYAAAAGYTEVALAFGDGITFMRDDYRDVIARMGELLEQNGLVCRQTHLPFYHLHVDSGVTKEEMETAIKRCLWASGQLGAPWTAYHPRSAVNEGYNRQKAFADNKRFLTEYLEEAERHGVGIAVENMPLYPYSNPDWRFFGGSFEELCELCDVINSDKLGICWDFGHAHTAALNQPKALKAVGDRLKITHVHDNYRHGDHHQLPLLGSTEWGCIEWSPVMQTLKEIGYEGPMTLEVIFPPEPMRKSFIQCSYNSLELLETLRNT